MIKYLPKTIFPAYVAFTTCEKDYKRELKRLNVVDVVAFLPSKAASALRLAHVEHGETYIIFAPNLKNLHKNQIVSVIAHEVVHVVDWIFEYAGETTPGFETRAYLTQFLLQNCLYLYDDMRKGRKK